MMCIVCGSDIIVYLQFKLQKETLDKNEKTADAKVSRNFTFRVQDDSSPTKKKKKRVRRPDTDDEEDAGKKANAKLQ